MANLRRLLALAWNEIRLYFSTPITLVFFVLLPVVFTGAIGAGLSGMEGDGTDRYAVLVVNEDEGGLAQALVGALEDSAVVRPIVEEDRLTAEERFEERQAPALLSIPSGFSAALLQGQPGQVALKLAPSDSRALAVEQAVTAATGQVSSAVAAALTSVAEAEQVQPFSTEADRTDYFQEALDMAGDLLTAPPVRVEVTQGTATASDDQTMSGFEQSSAGQVVTWTLITLIGGAESLVDERLRGTLRRILVTPSRRAILLGGKIVGRLAIGLAQMVLLVVAGALLFNVEWGQSPTALALSLFCFGLAATALGLFLATLVRTRSQVGWATVMVAMLLGSLGGAWWPLEITPPAFQRAVSILPTTWAMQAFNDVLVRGADAAAVLPECGVLLGFATLFFVLGIWRFRFD